MMEAIKLRKKLIDVINSADENLLHVVQDVIDSYNYMNTSIVSEPISSEQYNKDIEAAEQDIKNGDVFTHDEVGEIIKRWRKA